jgi:hypothetical protein
MKVLCSMLVDQVWSNKTKKRQDKSTFASTTLKPYISRSSAPLSHRSDKFLFKSYAYSPRNPKEDLVVIYRQSEFSQCKGPTFPKAPKDQTLHGFSPGPGSYEAKDSNRDRTPRVIFTQSKRPDHFTKEISQELYNPLHYFVTKTVTKS